MKKKGFTLVELLVVIAIIAMLLAILMPALGKVRALAYRLMCGTNLSGIGKAMNVYSNDYLEQYPVTTGGTAAAPVTWDYKNSVEFWDLDIVLNSTFSWTTVTTATASSSLYLLIKYADVSPKQFVCSSSTAKKFEITTQSGNSNYTIKVKDPTQAWDFGQAMAAGAGAKGPWNFCSYAYQMPYTPTGANMIKKTLSVTMAAANVLAADSSPWYKNGAKVTAVAPTTTSTGTGPYIPSKDDWGLTTNVSANKDRIKLANSTNHNQDGQNVLYNDCHVNFESQSNVGVNNDNIYTYWISNVSNVSTDQSEV
ncbi:MAG: type II secretion system protein, partial [Sedimentisphaerales bacterium]|nr:type II secretion system protein [Sedimentisphaerales bacterium]